MKKLKSDLIVFSSVADDFFSLMICNRYFNRKRGRFDFFDMGLGGLRTEGKDVAFSLPQIVIDDISKQNASANGHLALVSKAFHWTKFDSFQNTVVDQIFSSMNTEFSILSNAFKKVLLNLFINYFKELIMKLFPPVFGFLTVKKNN